MLLGFRPCLEEEINVFEYLLFGITSIVLLVQCDWFYLATSKELINVVTESDLERLILIMLKYVKAKRDLY